MTQVNPELDLTITRVIRAPRQAIWRAWTDPAQLAQWWIPAPARCQVQALDIRPGGAFETLYSEDGVDFGPHVSGCFLDVLEGERLVFTDTLLAGWRPAEAPFMTAVITLRDHAEEIPAQPPGQAPGSQVNGKQRQENYQGGICG